MPAILFDVGGVLLRTEDPTPRRSWAEHLHLAQGQLDAIVFDNPVALRATVGDASNADVWREAGRILALSPVELIRLQSEFFAGDRWDQALLDFIQRLRPQFRTGVLSNAWPDARRDQAQWIHPDVFDVILYSAEERCRKPQPEYYRLALDRLNTAAHDTVFIDDFQANVDAACALGIRGVLYKNPQQIQNVIAKIIGDIGL